MFRLILFFISVASVYSLSCPCWREPDKTKYCRPPPTNCPLGLTTGPCGCCLQCYKDNGEACGGPWQIIGKCGKGLRCVKETNVGKPKRYYINQMEGVCKPIDTY
uniref:Venom protein n=1 Tax=Hadrurus spadix TaxID=141984 RepID=A0A1W7R940_9SCOR